MISVLEDWETRCGDVINDIEAEITNIKNNAEKQRAKDKARTTVFEKALEELQSEKGGDNAPSSRMARKMARYGPGAGGIGNKREFSSDDHDDDGYFENGSYGGLDPVAEGRMDIDEGTGSSRGTRQVKRVLGRKT